MNKVPQDFIDLAHRMADANRAFHSLIPNVFRKTFVSMTEKGNQRVEGKF